MPPRALAPHQEKVSQARSAVRRTLSTRTAKPLGLRASLQELQRTLGNQHLQRVMRGLARSGGEASASRASPTEVSATVESSIERARPGGRPLEAGVRDQMESTFGADFSGVRVHTDQESHVLNRSLQAEAFTTGRDIFFGSGAYEPTSSTGRHLLAHELAHVVQQSGAPAAEGGAPLQAKLELSHPHDADEVAAEEVARTVTGALDGATAAAGAGTCEACSKESPGPGKATGEMAEEEEGEKPNPHAGDATIQCDGGGGYEVVLNGWAGATCGTKGCVVKHESSHMADWKAKWPDGCKAQAKGYLPKGDPPDNPLMTVAEYTAFLKASECKAHTVDLTCAEALPKTGGCKTTVEDYVDLTKRQKAGWC